MSAISECVQNALKLRFPRSNFTAYFEYLKTCPELSKGTEGTEEHHIIPVSVLTNYNGKLYELHQHSPENKIVLFKAAHDTAHLLLGKAEPWLLRTGRRARGLTK
jgi:hypothetical protein